MNGKKGSVEINIASVTKMFKLQTGSGKKSSSNGDYSFQAWMWKVWEFAKEDSNRVKFSFKVGLAVLLVSLLILFRAPYDIFGTNIIWSILTVAIMFEYTVGATFNRGFNRALGSLLAGILAIGVAQVALTTSRVAEPIIIGIGIFFIGAITSFMKLWPSLAPCEYGFRVILFTYCLIIVSGYRMGNPIRTAMDRLYYIAIGGFVAVLVNVLVFSLWAGEQLHKELVNNFNSVADSLEECVKKYLEDEGLDHPEFSSTVMDEFPHEPAYKKCKTTLNSSAKLESLAPYNLRITFQTEIQEVTSQAAELVQSLGKDVGNMTRGLKTCLLKKVHSSTERLQQTIDMHSYLLTTYCYSLDNSSKPFPRLSSTFSSTFSELPNQQADPGSNSVQKNPNPPIQNMFSETIPPAQAESFHETMRKQSRRLYSWPSREVDAFEEDASFAADFLPRMKALESTVALSLATFTSLLIEFVARLDHLVEAVDELSKVAKFKHGSL